MQDFYALVQSRLTSQPWKPALGAGLAIALLASLKQIGFFPYLIAPLGASATLVWMVPNSPLARGRAVIGGSLISALIGLGVLALLSPTPWAIGLAVGLAIFAMVLLDVLHAPAGALPLVIGISHPDPLTFLVTLAASTILLVGLGRLYLWLTEPKTPIVPRG
ncbi:MAG: HPP family protein [Aquidulcibacter sp.]|uniref:HPP family protein n=1 Tax=Aquidulcibacter sp. TaxID=2052990 RepID=UPI0022BF97F9|nr:HPP family protein [Aquidulcibacter sp.]MCE2892199.1 HPP family protein [Hyphomonadaceae bacterium]MCZ8208409.1 HPP family protein [Aquidulcibacter sp.]